MRNLLGALAAAALAVILVSACGSGATKPAATASPASAVSATAAATLAAQQATPAANPLARVMGPVASFVGSKVTIQDGSSFTLDSQTAITRRTVGTAADIQPGSAVAVTAKRQPDNTLLASLVVTFATAPGGDSFYKQFPLDAGNLMTNATIDKATGPSFTVTFPGGGDRVTLASDAQIQRVVKGAASDIKVGSSVSAAVKDGVAQSVSIQ